MSSMVVDTKSVLGCAKPWPGAFHALSSGGKNGLVANTVSFCLVLSLQPRFSTVSRAHCPLKLHRAEILPEPFPQYPRPKRQEILK